MRNLLRLLLNYHFQILFLILEILAFILLFNHSYFQRSRFITMANAVETQVYRLVGNWGEYFSLREENRSLLEENTELKNRIDRLRNRIAEHDQEALGTDSLRKFRFIPAAVLNNSVTRRYNYITLDKGREEGVQADMGIVSPRGIAGKIIAVSPKHSIAMSVLNENFRVPAKLKKNNYYGSLSWTTGNPKTAILSEIPYHVNVSIGDTVVTSGFSAVFPEDLNIGLVDEFEVREGNFYIIQIRLATDFRQLHDVYIIKNLNREEIITLEDSIRDD